MSQYDSMPLVDLLKSIQILEAKEEIEDCFAAIAKRLDQSIKQSIRSYMVSRLNGTREGLLYEVQDIMQELFVAIWKKADQFRGTTEASAVSWCKTIAENIILNKARKALRRKKFQDSLKEKAELLFRNLLEQFNT